MHSGWAGVGACEPARPPPPPPPLHATLSPAACARSQGRLIPAPDNLPNLLDLESELVNNNLPLLVYAYLSVWLVLSIVGLIVQFRYTGRKPTGRENEKDEWEQVVEDGRFAPTRGSKRGRRSGKKDRERRSASRGGSSRKVRASQRLKAAALLQEDEDGYYEEEDTSAYSENGVALPPHPSAPGGPPGAGAGEDPNYGAGEYGGDDGYYEEQQQMLLPPAAPAPAAPRPPRKIAW